MLRVRRGHDDGLRLRLPQQCVVVGEPRRLEVRAQARQRGRIGVGHAHQSQQPFLL